MQGEKLIGWPNKPKHRRECRVLPAGTVIRHRIGPRDNHTCHSTVLEVDLQPFAGLAPTPSSTHPPADNMKPANYPRGDASRRLTGCEPINVEEALQEPSTDCNVRGGHIISSVRGDRDSLAPAHLLASPGTAFGVQTPRAQAYGTTYRCNRSEALLPRVCTGIYMQRLCSWDQLDLLPLVLYRAVIRSPSRSFDLPRGMRHC